MKSDFEDQIKETHAKLDKFKDKWNFFSRSIIPKPEVYEEELKLISELVHYDKSVLISVVEKINRNNDPTSFSLGKTSLEILRGIAVLPLIILVILSAPILYYANSGLFVRLLIVVFIVSAFIVVIFGVKELFIEEKRKNRNYLIKQAIKLKESAKDEEDLQQHLEGMRDIMAAIRKHNIKPQRVISLLRGAIKVKQKEKDA